MASPPDCNSSAARSRLELHYLTFCCKVWSSVRERWVRWGKQGSFSVGTVGSLAVAHTHQLPSSGESPWVTIEFLLSWEWEWQCAQLFLLPWHDVMAADSQQLAVPCGWLQQCLCLLSSYPTQSFFFFFTSLPRISISQAPGNVIRPLFFSFSRASEVIAATSYSGIFGSPPYFYFCW